MTDIYSPPTIDPPPVRSTLPVTEPGKAGLGDLVGELLIATVSAWVKWLQQVCRAVNRIVLINESITFPNTASGSYSVHTISLPAGTSSRFDSVALTAPLPVNGTCFTVAMQNDDEVLVVFNNYSGAIQNFPLPQAFIVTIWRN